MVPRLVPCDLSRVRLAAPERFVLSKIDGRRSIDDIARAVSIDAGGVKRVVDRLVALGAVSFSARATSSVPPFSRTRLSAPPPPDSTPTLPVAEVRIPEEAKIDATETPTVR